jgi:hypothetical protein
MNGASMGDDETRNRAKKRALSASARAEKQQKLTCTYLEIDMVECNGVAEPNDQPADGDGDHER